MLGSMQLQNGLKVEESGFD